MIPMTSIPASMQRPAPHTIRRLGCRTHRVASQSGIRRAPAPGI
jgi:hypothetical protein